jgi:hypothetical protein
MHSPVEWREGESVGGRKHPAGIAYTLGNRYIFWSCGKADFVARINGKRLKWLVSTRFSCERVVVKMRFCLLGIADYAANVYYSCWRILSRLIY